MPTISIQGQGTDQNDENSSLRNILSFTDYLWVCSRFGGCCPSSLFLLATGLSSVSKS